jgi:hypothetical protein
MGFVSFRMLSSVVLELNDALYFHGLTKTLFVVSVTTNLACVVEFDNQQVIIKHHSEELGCVLSRGM